MNLVNRAERRRELNRSQLPRRHRLVAVVVSATVMLAGGLLAAAPARAAVPSPDDAYPVGNAPLGIAVNPTGTIAVTANSGSDTASVIDLGTGAVTDVGVGVQPFDVAIDPSGTYAYVTNNGSNSVSQIRLSDNLVTQIPVGNGPTKIVIDPAGIYAYVTVGSIADRITLSDLTVDSGFLTHVNGPLLVTSDGSTIYSYANISRRYIAFTGLDDTTFVTGHNPTGAGFNADQTAIYGVNDSGWVRRTELAGLTTRVWDTGLAGYNSSSWVSVGNFAYVTGLNDSTLYQVNLLKPETVTTLATDLSGPSDAAVPPDGTFILVASAGADKVFRYTLPSPPPPPMPPGEGPRALVWGNGSDGALGTGGTGSEFAPVQVAAGANALDTWGMNWYSMDGGWDQTCGVGIDQRAYCWGLNGSGQLGNGTTDDSDVPVAVAPGANAANTWLSVSAGSDYSSCGVGTDEKAYCWGYNGTEGQLGDGTANDSSTPVAVVGGPVSWSLVRVGAYHACGLGTDDEAYCWGLNASGQLGGGTTTNSAFASQVAGGPASWREISAGDLHTCGIGTNNIAYCWGDNTSGQLGTGTVGTTADDSLPVQVLDGENSSGSWKSIATGQNASCGIGGDDQAYCWGWDASGQLGNGSAGDETAPVRVDLPLSVNVQMLSMDAYAEHVCALTSDNLVYCWGSNSSGQLGDGTGSNSDVPVEVDLNAAPSAHLNAGTPRMVAVGSSMSLMVSAFGTAPTFTAASPPSTGTVGTPYATYTFAASGTAPITITKASGSLPPGLTLASNGVLSGTPTAPGTYTFAVTASNGVNPDATTSPVAIEVDGGTPTPPNPGPPAPEPWVSSSAPRDVIAKADVESAAVSWLPPMSQGAFPVTSYEAVASPGGQRCVVAAPSLTCTITGLTAGTPYTVIARALTAAGWGEASSPTEAVVPLGPDTPTILIVNSRDRTQKSVARVEGSTTGLVGAEVVPYIRFAGKTSFAAGKGVQTVDARGRFVWQRKATKRFTIYFVSGDVASNRLVIRPER